MRVSRRTHPDILRLLKQQETATSHRSADVLNAINAFDTLGELERRPPARLQVFGPKAVGSAVVVWYKRTSYHSYKTLNLFGLWAIEREDDAKGSVTLCAGTRTLTYCAPFYSAESYFSRIRQDFTRYYGEDVPPPETPIWQTAYIRERRLDIRQEISALVQKWRTTPR